MVSVLKRVGSASSKDGACEDIKTMTYNKNTGDITAPLLGLSPLFYPKSIAVIGATERPKSVGRTVMENLIKGNKGKVEIYPINPKGGKVFDIDVKKSVDEIENGLDCAIVIIPAKFVLSTVEACGKAGCKSLIILTAGFKEVGPEGAALEDKIVATVKKYGIRLIGPNCLGLMMPRYGLNATFAARMALEGSLAFISQSGAMCTAALDWSIKQNVGFSCFASIGSMADVDWADIIEYLGQDNDTSAILIYMETIGNARSFLSAARKVTNTKPIVVLKAGKSDVAAKAAASHTGSLAGSHGAYVAAMRRCGVLCVDSIRELFDVANVIDKQPRPRRNQLTIITNAGGPGVLATDAVATNGGDLGALEQSTIDALDEFLPSAWSRANPVDILGDADAVCYSKTMDICLRDENAGGVLVILSPQSVTEPMETAKAVVAKAKEIKEQGGFDKPIICSWMGGVDVGDAFAYLNDNGIPCLDSPDDAAKTFCQLYEQYEYTALAREPARLDWKKEDQVTGDDGKTAMKILENAYTEGQHIISEFESKEVLKSFGIPIAETIVCTTAEEAGEATKLTGFPTVVKLHSDTITHKSDVGGVLLSLKTKDEVIAAFSKIKENLQKNVGNIDGFQGVTVQPMLDLSAGIELLAGSVVDPQFGPLVVFGGGGCMVEVYQDTCTAIPPLTDAAADLAIRSTKISKALIGVGNARFPGVDMSEVKRALIGFSNLVARVGQFVSEIEINPLLALKDRVVALDARIVMRSKDDEEPVMHPIIRPWPNQYVKTCSNGEVFRLLRAADKDNWVEFVKSVPESCFSKRYINFSNRDDVLINAMDHVNSDYDNSLGFAVFREDKSIKCITRVKRIRQERKFAQFQILRPSEWSDANINDAGRLRLQEFIDFVIEACKAEGIEALIALVCEEDIPIMKRLGFGNEEGVGDSKTKLHRCL